MDLCTFFHWNTTSHLAQSVTCLTTDVYLTADPGVASSIPSQSHTFLEIDHEIISMVIPHPSADSFKKGCCQYVDEVPVNCFFFFQVLVRILQKNVLLTIERGKRQPHFSKS